MKRAVLAYSGGLDTSVTIRWLVDEGYDVHAVAVDVGQQEDFDGVVERGRLAGATDVRVADAVDRFAQEYLTHAIKANGLYEGKYPMVSGLARPAIVQEVVKVAREIGADVVAHGCTGKGNDQVRFEVGIGALAPELEVLAPVRDSGMTRDKAIAFAEEKGLPIDQSKRSPYSVDQNLWGRAVETGFLEDPWNPPIEDVYSYTAAPGSTSDEVVISFVDGVPTAIDGKAVSVLDAILELNTRAGAQGVGRLDMVEDRLVGIKSREVYEAPGAIALITAHQELEDLTVERDLRRFKFGVEQRWTEIVYDGLWFSPLRRALDEFVNSAQRNVTGDIRLRLSGGAAVPTGRRGEGSLYDFGLATYDTGDTFDQSLAKGFVQLWGLPSRIAARRDLKSHG